MSLHIGELGRGGPTLHIPSDQHLADGGVGDRGRFMRLAAWINVESQVAVGCVGAVLAYLLRRAAIDGGGSGGGQEELRVLEVEMVTMNDTMMVGVEAMSALRVFEREGHPTAQGGGGVGEKGKEGLSLFGLLTLMIWRLV